MHAYSQRMRILPPLVAVMLLCACARTEVTDDAATVLSTSASPSTTATATADQAARSLKVLDRVIEKNKPHKPYGNLRTDQEFTDFNLTLETRVAEGGNSGVYLRGIYEVQVMDSYGKPLDSHNMGAIYSRITPSQAAEKPPGEWQTLDITLVDRHVTVILNGKKIIDNQPLEGCTGGALGSDVTKPGPIYLQGDHTGIEYRNIVLRPVVKTGA